MTELGKLSPAERLAKLPLPEPNEPAQHFYRRIAALPPTEGRTGEQVRADRLAGYLWLVTEWHRRVAEIESFLKRHETLARVASRCEAGGPDLLLCTSHIGLLMSHTRAMLEDLSLALEDWR